MLSPRSRGKGSRRLPVERGRGKRKSVNWRKQAQHAVDSVDELKGPTHLLVIHGFYGDWTTDMIYRFDQGMAKIGLHYYAEFAGRRHAFAFKVWVLAARAADVQEIIARIRS